MRKANVLENYYTGRDSDAIVAYEKGIELDFEHTEFYYIDRLGVLYIKHMEEEAIEIVKKIFNSKKLIDV